MLMDHGVPWWSATAPTGATGLTVWLMKQGIAPHWSGYRHPQTQGKVERFHGSLERALQARRAPRQEPQPWLDAYRWEHNHDPGTGSREPTLDCGRALAPLA
jgi:transposase InsO family protein